MVSAIASKHFSSMPQPIAHPIHFLADKIRSATQKVFGYFLRIMVFQLSMYKNSFSYGVMRVYQKLMGDSKGPVDFSRLQRSRDLLIEFGGVVEKVKPADGNAEVDFMVLRAKDFFQQIENLSGRREKVYYEGEERAAIFTTPENEEILFQKLEKFYLPRVEIEGRNAILLPHAPKVRSDQTTPFILRSHSPGRSFCMDRKFIGRHLAAGYDVCVWDPRGTIESKGSPSEGGYYLDAEAVFDRVIQMGVPKNRIYLSGYCEGAGVNAYLKKKYHREGVHFIAENTFHNLISVIERFRIGRLLGKIIFPALQSNNPSIKDRVQQDGFDVEAKFQGLPEGDGKFIILHTTKTDRLIPKNAVERIRNAVGKAGPYVEIERIHPDPKADGHMEPPTQDDAVWRRYVEIVI